MEMPILTEQTNLGGLPLLLTKALRRVHRKQQGFRSGLVGPEIATCELNYPTIVPLDDEITRVRHAFLDPP